MTVEEAIDKVRERMEAKYPNFWDLAGAERRLLVMAYLCDQLKVREDGGNNRGVWVNVFLQSAGVDPGNPWCAAAVTFASKVAKAKCPKDSPAAVRGWLNWAKTMGFLVEAPQRGSICMHQTTETTGHIALVVKVIGVWVYSIEGNTGSGDKGSQRDGDGMYRRVRLMRFWSWGFAHSN